MTGILQADAYGGYGKLYEADRSPGSILEARAGRMRGESSLCWPMSQPPPGVRPGQADRHHITSDRLEAVRRIDALFEIERDINGMQCEQRRAERQELSAPLVADLRRRGCASSAPSCLRAN